MPLLRWFALGLRAVRRGSSAASTARCAHRSSPLRGSLSRSSPPFHEGGRRRRDVVDVVVVEAVVGGQHDAVLHDPVGPGYPPGAARWAIPLKAGWRRTFPVHTIRVSMP